MVEILRRLHRNTGAVLLIGMSACSLVWFKYDVQTEPVAQLTFSGHTVDVTITRKSPEPLSYDIRTDIILALDLALADNN